MNNTKPGSTSSEWLTKLHDEREMWRKEAERKAQIRKAANAPPSPPSEQEGPTSVGGTTVR